MQHIVTKFVIKFLALAYLIFDLKYSLCFFSNIKKACKDNINKIRLAERFINELNAIPKPKIENPIAYQRLAEEACVPSQPQIMPLKKATTMPPYIART